MSPRLLPVPDGLVGERIDVALARMTGLSRSRVGELCGRGDVRLGGAALSKSERLPEGAVLLAENEGCPVQAYRVGERLYATQFHPEPTGRAFTERMAVYRDDGYFAANDFDRIATQVLAASLTQPPRILRAFATTF